MSSPTPGLVVLDAIRTQAEQVMRCKPVSTALPLPPHQQLPPESHPDFPEDGLHTVRWDKLFLPQDAFGLVFYHSKGNPRTVVLGMKSRALCALGKHSITEHIPKHNSPLCREWLQLWCLSVLLTFLLAACPPLGNNSTVNSIQPQM